MDRHFHGTRHTRAYAAGVRVEGVRVLRLGVSSGFGRGSLGVEEALHTNPSNPNPETRIPIP